MFIAVSGNIGTGKTTLVKKLSEKLSYQAEFEAVADNPYLEDFYQDMKRWAFPLQVYFLGHRFRQGLKISENKGGIVLDRTIYEDAHVFAYNLRTTGLMSERDYHNYHLLYETMQTHIKAPDVLVYLRGSVEQLLHRINQRSDQGDRAYESKIPASYLQDLNRSYERWIGQYDHSAVITINIDDTDLSESQHFEKLVKDIQRYKDA
ncbi:MAG: deoxynucleoside kinase [Cyclobacteriaceae bacterium]